MELSNNLYIITQVVSALITYRMYLVVQNVSEADYFVSQTFAPSFTTIKNIAALTEFANIIFFIIGFFYMDHWWEPMLYCFILPGIISGIISKQYNFNITLSQIGCFAAPILTFLSFYFLLA